MVLAAASDSSTCFGSLSEDMPKRLENCEVLSILVMAMHFVCRAEPALDVSFAPCLSDFD